MKPNISSLKKKVWKVFSEYVRRRDADWRGNVTCCTCGVVIPWKSAQSGHFIGGRRNGLLFDERGVHAQCFSCNIWKHGDQVRYFRFMQRKYGDKVIKELEKLDLTPKQFTIKELESLQAEFKTKLDRLTT